MKNQKITTALKVLVLPVAYALILRLFFVNTWEDLFTVMSISFLFCVPTIMGALTVYFSSQANAEKLAYRIFAPWAPMAVFFMVTLAIKLEGWACWLMVLPIFLLASSGGGLLGGYLKRRNGDSNKIYMSALSILPLLVSPIENMIGAIPGTYKAYTFIDIDAPAEKIWGNVTRVGEIPPAEDSGWLTAFLGFPRPVKAELDFEGVGAKREAVFTGGLTFHETVSEYEHQKKMVFSIKASPHEIPSTTMDAHVVIGGRFFDVLDGTYELEKLANGKHRLHLYSRFEMATTFNFYAGLWAGWIMKDIQNNILRIEKKRSEAKDALPS